MESLADGRILFAPGRIARIVLNAPASRNAMAQAMWAALPGLMARIAADGSVRAVILGGAGGAFSAGADITEFAAIYATEASALAANATIRAALASLRDLPRPTIAAVDGACIGGGVALMLACDHAVAARDAVFAIPPARLGIAYAPEDTAMLLERLSAPRAKDMLMTARRLDAAQALDWGLVDALAEDPAPAAAARAEALAALSPASIRQAKRTVNALAAAARDADLARGLADLFRGPDFAEGRAAFLERRPPRF